MGDGGFVAGGYNTVSGVNTSVSGGSGSTASGGYSSVSGGGENAASGTYASVSGGQFVTESTMDGWATAGYHTP